jgi:hypothetical protein
MSTCWEPGQVIAWRGIYNHQIWHALPVVVVKDAPTELALAILPGAEGFLTEGYSEGKQNGKRRWDFKDKPWKLERFIWHTHRVLLLLEPQKYYDIEYFWDDESDEFKCFYVNFQLPFQRNPCGIDALDLELDIVVNPDFSWHWKDVDDYQKAIESGLILKEWVQAIEDAKLEVLERLKKRSYPFDNSWLNWRPNLGWPAPKLPAGWDKV